MTRILQDSVGVNYQSLFLGYTFLSDSHVNERIATLQYANRTRNVMNVSTKNVDSITAQLQRICTLTNLLQHELVKSRFNNTYPYDKSDKIKRKIQNIHNDYSQIGEISDGLF